jgi:hypothetical protein
LWHVDLSASGSKLGNLSGKVVCVLTPAFDVVKVVADHAATLTNFTPAMLNLAPCDATIESSASQSTVIAYTGRGVFDAFKIAQVDGVNKGYDDVGVYGVCKGAHVSTFALDIPSDGKITATFNMACLDYADSETSIVVSPNAPTTTPFLSNNNVGTILVNGQSLEGVACVSAMTVNLDNSLQTQRCLGSDSLGPGAHIATEAAITGSITLAWSKRAWEIWKNTFTRAPIGVVFPITDSLGNKYTFNFPAVEVDGELPNGGKRDLIEVTLNYTVVKVSPTITRAPFVPVTSVSVAPSTATITATSVSDVTKTSTAAITVTA